MEPILIRKIVPDDNRQIECVIRSCFYEFNIPLIGTAFEDSNIKNMYEAYNNDNEVYFVVCQGDEVLGGAGIKPLKDTNGTICELNKMYFSPKVRGKGFGKQLFQKCLDAAREIGYKQCYLESGSQLKTAIHIYESFGFKHLDGAIGNTGHYSCSVWMLKDL